MLDLFQIVLFRSRNTQYRPLVKPQTMSKESSLTEFDSEISTCSGFNPEAPEFVPSTNWSCLLNPAAAEFFPANIMTGEVMLSHTEWNPEAHAFVPLRTVNLNFHAGESITPPPGLLHPRTDVSDNPFTLDKKGLEDVISQLLGDQKTTTPSMGSSTTRSRSSSPDSSSVTTFSN